MYSVYGNDSDVPGFQLRSFEWAKKQFGPVYDKVKAVDDRLKALQAELESQGMPYIKGSLPKYKK